VRITTFFNLKTAVMKNFSLNAITRTLPLLLLQVTIAVTAIAQGFSNQTKANFQKVIDDFQNSTPYIGGMSVAIKVDGIALWQGATGYSARNIDAQNNLLPGGAIYDPCLLSRMYIFTKTFTAALVLELAREGAFALNEPISKYLPLLSVVNPSLNPNVTIQQLLAHESGYSDYTEEMQLQIAVAFDPTHIWTPYEMASFVHQVSPPGTVRRYSSTNYILLGAIIEAATGTPVEQHFRKRFFERLGLRSMFLAEREPIGNRPVLVAPHDNISPFNPIFQLTGQPTFPNGYTNISRFPMNAIASLAFTGGGLVTNAADMAEWGNALFGGRATSYSTLQTMLKSISATPDEDGDKLGYGIFTNTKISETDFFVGHDGSAPGYRALMFYQPDRKMTIAILSNFAGAKLYDVAKALYEVKPDFICENSYTKDEDVKLCLKGRSICVPRRTAPLLVLFGATLGGCERSWFTTEKSQELDEVKHIIGTDKFNIFPNPFRARATVTFSITQTGPVSLQLFDMNGKLLSTLFNGKLDKGTTQQANVEASQLPAGIYIMRLQTAAGVKQQRLVLTR
jgi:CubicO group peptidase (beta-lactamase class C family)